MKKTEQSDSIKCSKVNTSQKIFVNKINLESLIQIVLQEEQKAKRIRVYFNSQK
jgi:hypothetical protein